MGYRHVNVIRGMQGSGSLKGYGGADTPMAATHDNYDGHGRDDTLFGEKRQRRIIGGEARTRCWGGVWCADPSPEFPRDTRA